MTDVAPVAETNGPSSAADRPRFSRRKRLLFALVAVLLMLGTVEGMLRLTGFQWSTSVETMSFTFPIDEYNANSDEPFLERDPVLFWKPRPNVLGHNERGMIGPDFADAKPSGVYRIVCLGDSCTHFGPDSYPEQLQSLLDESGDRRFEVINAACIGYTSHQGLQLLETKVVDWEPDLVTVYFGWNDHWLAHQHRDSEQTVRAAPLTALHNSLDRLRLYQLVNLGVTRLGSQVDPKMRVELDEYRHNLQRMAEVCNELGAEIWYLTAPHAFDLGIPEYLLTSGEVSDPFGLVELHTSYNDVVRQVAREQDAVCIDLDAEFDRLGKLSMFVDDHIHLSEKGRKHVAVRLQEQLQAEDITDAAVNGEATPAP